MEAEYIQEIKLLYDDVRQLLYSIIIGFQYSELQKVDPRLQRHFTELRESTCELFGEIQRSASHSQYLALSSFGFVPAIRRWIKKCEDEYSLLTIFETNGIDENERWPLEQEVELYELCKEWINQMSLDMTRSNRVFSLTISKRENMLEFLFSNPKRFISDDCWHVHLLQNMYLRKDKQQHLQTYQVLMQESSVAIIVSLDGCRK